VFFISYIKTVLFLTWEKFSLVKTLEHHS